jgi:hypothetical protein
MSFVFKNNSKDSLSVLIEPSTDEFLLKMGDILLIKPKFDEINNLSDFEFHLEDKELIIWLPHGQSADIYINGVEYESYASKQIW